MRTLGIIGGLGPASTIDYYRSIIARVREGNPDAGYPHIIVNSLDVDKGLAMLDAGRLDQLADYIASGFEALAHAGAEFGCIAANTPHLVFGDVQRRVRMPLVSIVEATAKKVQTRGFKKVGLFGTGFTMRASFYPDEFRRIGVALLTPSEIERRYIHQKYIGELLQNHFLPETRSGLLRIAQRMRMEDGVEAVILAGTELPLLLRESGTSIEFLDTSVIHVEAIVDQLLR